MNNRLSFKRDESGFTLVELLIVIVVLGVLAGVTVLAVGGIDKRGVAAACRSDFKSIEVAQQAYYAKNRAYAASTDDLVTANFLTSTPINTEYTVNTGTANNGRVTVNTVTPSVTAGTIAACDALN